MSHHNIPYHVILYQYHTAVRYTSCSMYSSTYNRSISTAYGCTAVVSEMHARLSDGVQANGSTAAVVTDAKTASQIIMR